MTGRILSFVAAVLCAIALNGCAKGMSLPKLPATPAGAYTLDSGDKIVVTVFGEPRLTGPYTVADNGEISMPLVGPIEARGKSINELQVAIAAQLQKGLVLNPGVSVQIEQYRPFFVLGEVANPGQYPYVEGMTVLTAAAIAGGFTFRAERDYVSVTRIINGKSQEYKANRNAIILPGDVINVYEKYL